MDVRVGPERRLRTEELMLLNCGAGEDSRDSRRQQGNQTNQSYNKSTLIFIGRTDAEAKALLLWPPNVKSWLTEKEPDAGKDWGQQEKEVTEGEMVGWHHQLNGHEFEQTPRDSEGQRSLECCSPWSQKESDTTEQLNNNKVLGECGWKVDAYSSQPTLLWWRPTLRILQYWGPDHFFPNSWGRFPWQEG